MNKTFLKQNLDELTIEFLKYVIEFSYSQGHNSYAPYGCSGDDFLLYGESRKREISLRLHSGDVKLLVTDRVGNFLFYGGFDTSFLPITFISEQYFNIIQNVQYLLDNTSKKASITDEDKEKMFSNRKLLHHLSSIHW